ncbi:MAG TPA: malate dehydrogenase, partial [Exilispira sp.]|nr:malate dehydrogenase [Exilispira sp.]
GGKKFSFGPDYIVPKPFDHRVIQYEAFAVAKAACEEGIAQNPIKDWNQYRKQLGERIKKFWK